MELVYDGPHLEVEIPIVAVTATKGKPVEVPDSIARALLEQETWTKVATKKKGGS